MPHDSLSVVGDLSQHIAKPRKKHCVGVNRTRGVFAGKEH